MYMYISKHICHTDTFMASFWMVKLNKDLRNNVRFPHKYTSMLSLKLPNLREKTMGSKSLTISWEMLKRNVASL